MKRIALFAIPVIIAAVIAVFVVTRKPDAGNTDTTNTTGNAVYVASTSASNTNTEIKKAEAQDRERIIAIARLFAERYGTSRSDDPSVSIENIISFSSASLAESLNRQLKRPSQDGAVVSTTTIALAFTVKSLNAKTGRAEVVVTTQRREETASLQPVVYSQDLALSFLREGDAWKVNSAIWTGRT